MDKTKNSEKLLFSIKKSLDTLILIELCKSGATRDQARTLFGNLDNNMFSKINTIFGKNRK